MDKKALVSEEVRQFIKKHENDDLHSLILQRNRYPDLPLEEIVLQIQARKKARLKIPSWYNTEQILYPQPVSIEQSSSEITAQWKADYIGKGQTGTDLTGGFGVDSYYFARNFAHWTHVEPNTNLQEVVKYNFEQLGVNNILFVNKKGEEYLSKLDNELDFIYLDPDRRPNQHRVAGFKDSEPDITKMTPMLKKSARQVLVKASPMIDIKAGVNDLEGITRVIILSVNNEVKEVLYHIDSSEKGPITIRCVDLKDGSVINFEFYYNHIFQEEIKISPIGLYLFEPNASIMKSGGQDVLASNYKLAKLNRNTNLYTAEKEVANFPGRCFRVISNEPYKKKNIVKYLADNRANLSTRNFIDTPEQMKKKLGIKDGGEIYMFGYRDHQNRNMVAVTEKIDSQVAPS